MRTLTPIDIHQREFRRQLFGYNREEVDDFLDEIITTLEALITENGRLKEEVAAMGARVQEYREREETINGAVMSAQAASEQMKANARKEAELIVQEARLQAERLVAGGQERLRQATEEAAGVQRQVQTIRTQLRSFLAANMEFLDSALPSVAFGGEAVTQPAQRSRGTDCPPTLEVITSKHA